MVNMLRFSTMVLIAPVSSYEDQKVKKGEFVETGRCNWLGWDTGKREVPHDVIRFWKKTVISRFALRKIPAAEPIADSLKKQNTWIL